MNYFTSKGDTSAQHIPRTASETMQERKILYIQQQLIFFICFGLLLCGFSRDSISTNVGPKSSQVHASASLVTQVVLKSVQKPFITTGNKNYVLNVSNRSLEEVYAILRRVEEISRTSYTSAGYLDIVLLLHKPEIKWFNYNSRQVNTQLIRLAAYLDAHKIIDFKACASIQPGLLLNREQIPPFIELVRCVPDVMAGYLQNDYIDL